jgi:MFS family permease
MQIDVKEQLSLSPKQALFRAGLVNIFSIMQLNIYRSYFAVYLEVDLLTTIAIISILASLQNLLQLFFRVPFAKLSQIIGRKPLITLGNLSFALSIFFMFLATDWVLVAVSAVLIALGQSFYWPAMFAYIGDIADGNYGAYNGRIFQFGDIGTIFAAVLTVYLLDTQTFYPDFSLGLLFGVFALIGFIGVGVSILLLPEVLADQDRLFSENVLNDLLSSFKTMIMEILRISRHPRLSRIYPIQFLIAFIEFGFVIFFPKLLVINYGYPNSRVAEILFISTLTLFFIKPYLGKISDILGYRIPITISLLITAIAIFTETVTENFVVLTFTYLLVVAMMMIMYPAINSATSSSAPGKERGIALGALGVYVSLGRGMSTIVLGPLIDWFDLVFTFKIFAFIVLFSAIIAYFVNIKRL